MEEGKFNRLSLAERADIVWERGLFVDSVCYQHYCVLLYSVNHDFIEVCVDLRDSSMVWVSLANEQDLGKYLRDVRIDL